MTALGQRSSVPHSNGLVGVARRDVTPPVGIRAKNWGPATWEAAEGIHRPMTLTAMALGSAEGALHVMIDIDATWWRRVDDEQRFRGAILEALELAPEFLT